MRSLATRSAAFVTVLSLLGTGSALAQTQTVFSWSFTGTTTLMTDQGDFTWLDRGWVNATGDHTAGNTNYITGVCDAEGCFGSGGPDNTSRSFFLFDLANLAAPITTATLRVYNPANGPDLGDGYYSPNPTELLLLSFLDPAWYDDAQVDNTGNLSFYSALFGGTLMGSRSFSAADNGFDVDIVLNAAAIASINSMRGELWGLGGCLDGVNCDGPTSTVPEPATMTLLATGLAGMAAARRRKRS